MYYVYVLKNPVNNMVYVGYTADLKRRCQEHRAKGGRTLVYYEAYVSERDARERERRLKDYGNALTALKGRIRESLAQSGCGAPLGSCES